jgi:hypothetical protein
VNPPSLPVRDRCRELEAPACDPPGHERRRSRRTHVGKSVPPPSSSAERAVINWYATGPTNGSPTIDRNGHNHCGSVRKDETNQPHQPADHTQVQDRPERGRSDTSQDHAHADERLVTPDAVPHRDATKRDGQAGHATGCDARDGDRGYQRRLEGHQTDAVRCQSGREQTRPATPDHEHQKRRHGGGSERL